MKRSQQSRRILNHVASLGLLIVLLYTGIPLLRWLVVDATFSGDSRSACTAHSGACWVFIKVWLGPLYSGMYPAAERWRVSLGLFLLAAGLVPLFWQSLPRRGWWILLGLGTTPPAALALFLGGFAGLPLVETSDWGGLMLTVVIAYVGILLALPLGLLLALGRRSHLPLLSWLSVGFIEFWRGLPLLTILFMSSVMLPLFLPLGIEIDKLLRALLGVSLFAAAYMAEVIRGGLATIQQGQYEAAHVLGLSYLQTMRLIILPQALRRVIPGIVNIFISLFKDTSLVLIIGMFDLLGMVQAAIANGEWLGLALEGYFFVGLVYWSAAFALSRYSLYLERRLAKESAI